MTNKKKEFDVFLCHNSADKSEVIAVANELKRRGLKPWLDIWELRPGFPWQDELQKQIKSIKSSAVFVGSNGMGPWQDFEQKAFLTQFMRRKCPVIPVLLESCEERPELPPFIAEMAWVDLRKEGAIDRLIWGITGENPNA